MNSQCSMEHSKLMYSPQCQGKHQYKLCLIKKAFHVFEGTVIGDATTVKMLDVHTSKAKGYWSEKAFL